ncbi:MAG: vWA domain-containing protein [Actinomycetota bacterium]
MLAISIVAFLLVSDVRERSSTSDSHRTIVGPNGGIARYGTDVFIEFPAGAFDASTQVTITGADPDPWERIARDAAVELIGLPIDVDVNRPLLKPATLTYRISAERMPEESGAFFANLHASGDKLAAAFLAEVNRADGHVSVELRSFSIYGLYRWVADRVVELAKGVIDDLIGPLSKASSPESDCDPALQGGLSVRDSNMNDAVRACAEEIGNDSATVKIRNTRAYPIELRAASSAFVEVEHGAAFERVGAAVNGAVSGSSSTLVPGRALAQSRVAFLPGESHRFVTGIGTLALLTSTLEVGLSVASVVYSKLRFASGGSSEGDLISSMIEGLSGAQCLADAITAFEDVRTLSLEVARSIGKVGMECVHAIGGDIVLGTIGGVLAQITGLLVGLSNSLVQYSWAIVDSWRGDFSHEIVASRGRGGLTDSAATPEPIVRSFKDCGPVDIAFVVDSTSSMDEAIENVRQHVAEFADRIASGSSGDYRLGLVDFGAGVEVHVPFEVGNARAIKTALEGMRQESGNLFPPEASDEALRTVVETRSVSETGSGNQVGDFDEEWRPGSAKRRVIVITDARPSGFDDDFQEGVDDESLWTAARVASEKGIKASFLFVPNFSSEPEAEPILLKAAQLGGGLFMKTSEDASDIAIGLNRMMSDC